MANYDLGTARGEVVLDFDQKGIAEANQSVDTFGSKFKKAAGIAVGGLGLITAGVGALILKGGLDRALNIQDAQKKLEGLGHTQASVTKIMGNALDAVRGTAFGLDEAATTAATAVAAGIKPGQQLTKYLKLTADTATIAGTSLGEMGSILNKAQASGTVFTDTLNQLSDRGIPVFPYLQKELHLSGDELAKFVAGGKLKVGVLQKVLEDNLAGSALASGNTTRGALKNVGAAFSRLGAAVVSGPLDKTPALFQAVAAAVDRFAAALAPANGALSKFISAGIERLTALIDKIDFTVVVKQITDFAKQVKAAFTSVNKGADVSGFSGGVQALGGVIAAVGKVIQGFLPLVGPLAAAFGKVLTSAIGVVPPLLDDLAGALTYVAKHSEIILPILGLLAAAYVLQKTQVALATANQLIHTGVLIASTTATRRATNATLLQVNETRALNGQTKIGSIQLGIMAFQENLLYIKSKLVAGAMLIQAGATKIATGAMKGLNFAIASNPIGLILTLIALLVAGLIYFFTQTETGRKAWKAFTDFLGVAFDAAVKGIQTGIKAIAGFLNSDLGKAIVPFIAIFSPILGLPLLIIQNWKVISGFFSSLFGQLGQFGQGFVEGFTSVWKQIIDAAQPAITFYQQNVVPIIVGVSKSIQDAFATVASGVSDAWNTIVGIITPVVTWIANNVGPLITGAMKVVGDAFATAQQAIADAWAKIQPIVQPVIDFLVRTIGPVLAPALKNLGVVLGVIAGLIVAALVLPMAIAAVAVGVIVAAIVGLIVVISKVIGFFAGLAGAIAGAVGAVATFFQGVWANIIAGVTAFIAGVQGFFNGLIGFFTDVVTNILAALQPFADWFATYVTPVITAFVAMIQAAWNLILAATNYVWELFLSIIQTAVGAVVTFVTTVIGGIVGFLAGVWQAIVTGVTTAWAAVTTAISTAVTAVVNAVTTFLTPIIAFVAGVWQQIVAGVTAAWNGIVSFIGGIVGTIVKNVVSFLAPIVGGVIGIINQVRGAFTAGFNVIVGFVSGVVGRIVTFISNGLRPIIAAAKTILKGFSDAVKAGIKVATDFVQGIHDNVVGFFAGAGKWLFNAGKQILEGLLGGLKDAFGGVTKFLDSVTAAIPQHKGPPSKDKVLLYAAGVLIMNGFTAGLKSGAAGTYAFLDGVAKTISGKLTPAKLADAAANAQNAKYAALLKASGLVIMQGLADGLGEGTDAAAKYADGKIVALKAKLTGTFADLATILRDNVGTAIATGTANDIATLMQSIFDAYTSALTKLKADIKSAQGDLADDQKALKDAKKDAADAKAKAAKTKGTDDDKEAASNAKKRLAEIEAAIKDDKSALAKLTKDLPSSAKQTALSALLKADNAELQKLAQARDVIATQLAAATAKLEAAIKTRDDYRDSIAAAVTGLGNIASAFKQAQSDIKAATDSISGITDDIAGVDDDIAQAAQDRAGLVQKMADLNAIINNPASTTSLKAAAQNQITALTTQLAALDDKVVAYNTKRQDLAKSLAQAQGTSGKSPIDIIVKNLQDEVNATNTFNSLIAQLKSMGLDDTSYKQLVDDFAQTGDVTAAQTLVNSGPAAVQQIAALQAQLKQAADQLGIQTSNSLYQAGVQAAQGIVDGLTSQKAQLDAAMTDIGNAMVAAIKQALGIHSPSKVMRLQVGQQAGRGVGLGIQDMQGFVQRHAANLLNAAGLDRSALIAAKLGVAGISAITPGVASSSISNRTMNYYAAPGTAQYSSEDSLFDSMRKTRLVAGW